MNTNYQKSAETVESATLKLLAYCQRNEWAGYDPYDALNSRLFGSVPLINSRFARLALTQLLKRLPMNVRSLLAIPPRQNSKGLALFLSAFLRMQRAGLSEELGLAGLTDLMVERISALRSTVVGYSCWGYSFPWQTRTIVVPLGTPNLVCTCFVADALLDVYDERRDSRCLNMAVSSAEYIVNELYWEEGVEAGFSYPLPSLRSRVHNANFLAAALLCRIYKITGDNKFLAPALSAARCSAGQQHADGSWMYGQASSQQWIDNFHTGYNLCALQDIGQHLSTMEFDEVVQRGYEFYRNHFFEADGCVKYFHDRTYPLDIHCVAQSIITLLKFKSLNSENVGLAHTVLQWALTHLWDDRGFFYYRRLRLVTNKIPYMRWSEAWMLLAMSMLLEESNSGTMKKAEVELAGAPSA